MAEPHFSSDRICEWEGGVYVIRDILHASGRPSGICQYAVRDGDAIKWHLCGEGVLYADIQPLLRLNNGG